MFFIVRAVVYRTIPNDVVDFHAEVVAAKSRFQFGPTKAVASVAIIQVIVIAVLVGGVFSVVF